MTKKVMTQILYKNPGDSNWSELSDYYDIEINRTCSETKKASTFSFKIFNKDNDYTNVISENTELKIRAKYSTDTSWNLLMYGDVTYVGPSIKTESGNVILIRGEDRIKRMFDEFTPGSYSNMTAKEIIEAQVNTYFNRRGLEIALDLADSPKVIDHYAKSSEYPFSAWLEELSGADFTGNGNYIYYISHENGENTLVWKPKPSTVDDSFNFDEFIENVYSYSFAKNQNEVVTSLLINAGKDLNGNAIYEVYQNVSQIQKNGGKSKWAYKAWPKIAQTLKYYNPSWDNDQIRTAAKEIAKAKAALYLAVNGNLTWKGEIVMYGNENYSVGNVIQVKSSAVGFTTYKKLRIREINHKINYKGWITTLRVAEDEKTLT